MTPDRWQQIQAVFEAALERPSAARAAFLAEACAGDDELRREVESLLEADTATHSLFEAGALDALGRPPDLLDELVDDAPVEGQQVGPYRLLLELGRGGMGVVYLAERADGAFEQRVALKLVKRGMDSDEILRRFRAERQILARLRHPGVARLLDGGVAADGRPYFALEYVEGEPIDAYCDRRRLPIEARLRLFAQVCEAVQYAHRNLVVHRDLKPSNILVVDDEEGPSSEGRSGGDSGGHSRGNAGGNSEGQVKLLDFGIAKLLAPDEDASLVVHTRTGVRVMTPEYAAPEQVRGEPTSTATDVYALGVLLYELLTGRRPYSIARRIGQVVERAILEEEPSRPSMALTQAPDADTLSQARATETARLRRRLAGDLDMICLMALRKEPDRRYSSAALLLDDVRRHLGGLPVSARPDGVGYRLGKFARRHRHGVAAAVGVLLVLAGVVGFYTAQLRQERDRAQAEAAKATEVAAFLRGIFEAVDPGEAQGETVTARELLDAGAVRIEEELAGQPEVQATLMRELGYVYNTLGLFRPSRPLLERALEQHLLALGSRHLETAATQTALAITLQDQGDVEAAEPLFRNALATRRALLPAVHADVSESLNNLGFWHETRGDFEAAERLYREALAIEDELHPPDDPRPAMMRTRLARLVRQLDRYDEAEQLLRQALAAQRRHFDGPHPDLASTLRNLAAVLRDTGAYGESEALYQEALAVRRALHGEIHPEVAHTLNSYALLLDRMGEPGRAIDTMRTFLDVQRQVHDGPHPSLAAGYHNVGTMLHDAGDLEGAADLFRQSMAVQDSVLAPDHPNRAHTLSTLSAVLREQGRAAEAEPMLRRALAIREAAYAADHRYVSDAKSNLGACLSDLGRYAEAESLLLDAHRVFLDTRGADDGRTQRAARRLADLYTAWGRPDEAARYREASGVER